MKAIHFIPDVRTEEQMPYNLLTDDEILADLAKKLDFIRRARRVKDEELVAKGGTSRFVLEKFRSASGGITLKSFVRLLRGLGELDRLELLLKEPVGYTPTGKGDDIPAHRVRDRDRKSNEQAGGFVWGDDR
jgi:hypothetical protein